MRRRPQSWRPISVPPAAIIWSTSPRICWSRPSGAFGSSRSMRSYEAVAIAAADDSSGKAVRNDLGPGLARLLFGSPPRSQVHIATTREGVARQARAARLSGLHAHPRSEDHRDEGDRRRATPLPGGPGLIEDLAANRRRTPP